MGGANEAAWFYTTAADNDSTVLKLVKQPVSAGSDANFVEGAEWTGSGSAVRKFHIDQNGTYVAGSDLLRRCLPPATRPATSRATCW